jgi:antitoxin (DNA-binding transcriptional repressor) of toxin-antitoxin stability system
MSETTLTVTEAARNFADCINRAHYQKQSFLLLKNGVPFARIIPVEAPLPASPTIRRR